MRVQLLGHYYKDNNMGDEAIHRQVKTDLESIDPFVEFVHELDKPELFICGGGGMYSDWQPEAFDTWLPPIDAAIRQNIPVVAYGVGIGPLFHEDTTRRLRRSFRAMDLVMVRDRASYEALGIDTAIVTGDPAIRYGYRHPVIGLNLVDIKTITALDTFFLDLIQLILSHADLKFFCLWPPHKNLYKRLMTHLNIDIPIIEAWDPDVFKREVCEVDLWMGMQYHGIIFANMNHKDCIALSYHHKCTQYANTMDLPQTLISDGQNLIPYSLKSSIEDVKNILEERFEAQSKMYQASDLNRKLLLKFVNNMRERCHRQV